MYSYIQRNKEKFIEKVIKNIVLYFTINVILCIIYVYLIETGISCNRKSHF